MDSFTCPVCAYSLMPYPADEGNICPCCGTEFGFDDDLGVSYRELRDRWVEHGTPWFSPVEKPSVFWDGLEQLAASEFEFTPPTWWMGQAALTEYRFTDEPMLAVEMALAG